MTKRIHITKRKQSLRKECSDLLDLNNYLSCKPMGRIGNLNASRIFSNFIAGGKPPVVATVWMVCTSIG